MASGMQVTLAFLLFWTNDIFCQDVENKTCVDYQGVFNLSEVIGAWRVVAIIPGEKFQKNQTISCFGVEFSETDVSGLRWLVNGTVGSKVTSRTKTQLQNGVYIRQRYHTMYPYDVWSKAVKELKGCFEQVLTLKLGSGEFKDKAPSNNSYMQLYYFSFSDGSKPLLLQMLWGKMINVVIYCKQYQVVSLHQLDIVLSEMKKLRKEQFEIKVCDKPIANQLKIDNI